MKRNDARRDLMFSQLDVIEKFIIQDDKTPEFESCANMIMKIFNDVLEENDRLINRIVEIDCARFE